MATVPATASTSATAPVMRLPTNGNDLAYDATNRFAPAETFAFLEATEATLGGEH